MPRKRVVVGQSSITAGQMKDFWRKVDDETICFDNFNRFLENPHGFNQSAICSTDVTDGGILLGSYAIEADCAKPVQEFESSFDWTYWNPNRTAVNFPAQPEQSGPATIELWQFPDSGTTAERERQLTSRGLELPIMHQELDFAVRHPDAWAGKPVISLGAAWVNPYGDRNVGYLYGLNGKRDAYLYWGNPDYRWNPNYVFAGVRK